VQIPIRMESALDYSQWINLMRETAVDELTMASGFEDDEKAQFPILVDAIVGTSAGLFMSFRIGPTSNLEDITLDAGGNPRWEVDQISNPVVIDSELFAKIQDWVETEKILKGRDFHTSDDPDGRWRAGDQKTPQEIAERVVHAIEENPDPFFRTDDPDHGALDPTGLAQTEGLMGLSSDAVGRALVLILNRWSKELAERVPMEVAQRIENAFS